MAFRNKSVQLAGGQQSGGNDKAESNASGDAAESLIPGQLPDAAWIKRQWKKGVEARRIVDREAWTNIAFIAGNHYAVWDRRNSRFTTAPPVHADRTVKLNINILLDLWRGEQAALTAGKPIANVEPETAEESDRQVALVGQRILDSEMHRLDWEAKRQEAAMWTTACGVSYIHPWWNPEAGKPEANIGPDGEPDGTVTKAGDICLDIIPHFEMVQDPACRFRLAEGQYAIHGRVLTVEEAYERFGQQFTPEADDTPYSWAQMFTEAGQGNTNMNKKGVLVLRMWHKPSRKFPKGFVITAAQNQIVETIEPYPYDHGELPFIDLHHIRIPGRFEGQSMLVSLVQLQKDYNQSRSRQAEIRKLMTSPGWMSPHGSLETDKITGTPGENIEYNIVGPYKPERLVIPNIPNFVFQTAETALQEMQDIAGQHDVSSGKAPAGTSGAAVLALQEKDTTKLATTLAQLEHGIAKMGLQILGLAQQYWSTPRAVRTWHEELDESGVTFFAGTDLNGAIAVSVVPGSALPKSKLAIQQNMMDLWEHKIITDASVVIKQMDLPNKDQLIDLLSVDSRQAKREHDRFFAADPNDQPFPEAWHNHTTHIQTHNDFCKTETYETKWPPALKAQLRDHVEQHYEFAMMQRQYFVDQAVAESVSAQSQMALAYEAATGGTQPLQGRLYMNPPAGMPAGPGGTSPQPELGSVPPPADAGQPQAPPPVPAPQK